MPRTVSPEAEEAVKKILNDSAGSIRDYKIELMVRAQGHVVSRNTIRVVRQQLGFPQPPPGVGRPTAWRPTAWRQQRDETIDKILRDHDGDIPVSHVQALARAQGIGAAKRTVERARKRLGYPPRPSGGGGHAKKIVAADANAALRQVVAVLKGMGVIEFHYKDSRMTIVRSQTVEVE